MRATREATLGGTPSVLQTPRPPPPPPSGTWGPPTSRRPPLRPPMHGSTRPAREPTYGEKDADKCVFVDSKPETRDAGANSCCPISIKCLPVERIGIKVKMRRSNNLFTSGQAADRRSASLRGRRQDDAGQRLAWWRCGENICCPHSDKHGGKDDQKILTTSHCHDISI